MGRSMMSTVARVAGVAVLWVTTVVGLIHLAAAADEDPKQDVCVANLTSRIHVNGFPCRLRVQGSDFASRVLRAPGAFTPFGVAVQTANVFTFPGLNTQGLAMNRVDYLARGLAIPHHHPRASEMIIVTQGTMEVAFVTTSRQPDIESITVIEGIQPNLTLYTNRLQPYDVAIIPRGHVHWVHNLSYNDTAQYIAAYNSENQGFAPTAQTLLFSNPPIPDYILAIAMQVPEAEIRRLRNGGHHYSDHGHA